MTFSSTLGQTTVNEPTPQAILQAVAEGNITAQEALDFIENDDFTKTWHKYTSSFLSFPEVIQIIKENYIVDDPSIEETETETQNVSPLLPEIKETTIVPGRVRS